MKPSSSIFSMSILEVYGLACQHESELLFFAISDDTPQVSSQCSVEPFQ
jgi:hypothetical protein